jgi:hypothetical protein
MGSMRWIVYEMGTNEGDQQAQKDNWKKIRYIWIMARDAY